jgi:hypothetical protein
MYDCVFKEFTVQFTYKRQKGKEDFSVRTRRSEEENGLSEI